MSSFPFTTRLLALALATVGLLAQLTGDLRAQTPDDFTPVTDAVLQSPSDDDWLMWRRTLDGWGYSPLDEITRENVDQLRMVWTRALGPGSQQGTPLAYDGVLYMPNPRDVIQALDAVTGDLLWEHRREVPDGVAEGGLVTNNRNVAIYGDRIIDTSIDDYVFALDATTGEMVWETEILDYETNRAMQSSGPVSYTHLTLPTSDLV